jgi:hypothetical protein
MVSPLKEDRWEILLRARAIENVSWVIRISQAEDRYTGQSMAVDPTGVIIAGGPKQMSSCTEAAKLPDSATSSMPPPTASTPRCATAAASRGFDAGKKLNTPQASRGGGYAGRPRGSLCSRRCH